MNGRPPFHARLGQVTAELWPCAAYEARDEGRMGVIGFAFEAQAGEDAFATDRIKPFRRRANTLAWIPPGCPVFSASHTGGEYLLLRGFTAADVGHPEAARRPVNDAIDPAALAAARALRRWLVAGRPDEQAGAAGVDVLRAVLLGHFHNGPAPAAGWLTPARLAALDRLIKRRMAERIEVAGLAAEIDVSVGFLVLAFRAALGTTPHRYLMDHRLARARRELAKGHKPIAVVALECGFADQAHLTRCMHRTLGVTPARYRRLHQV